ncbi:AraC family transcriptional regulator [Izhakiella australiensis]|uniref:AraC family transcriptional regulator n=1 Tax=Izhakiella australiensis TaxID=1926881 RepID=UPI0009902932|nr:AraC family transcriptional regulator [Izhakiella australiensis]
MLLDLPVKIAAGEGHASLFSASELRESKLHVHRCGQLVKADSGVLAITLATQHMVVPATHVLWLLPATEHAMQPHGVLSGWGIWLAEEDCTTLPSQPCCFVATPLLHQAVRRWSGLSCTREAAFRRSLMQVVIAEVATLKQQEAGVVLPREPRLRRIAQALLADPADDRDALSWATLVGMSPRTLTRRLVQETGLSFSLWRQQLRVVNARQRLAAGQSVKQVALSLGYDNVSAFIAMFQRLTGMTPAQWAADHHCSAIDRASASGRRTRRRAG